MYSLADEAAQALTRTMTNFTEVQFFLGINELSFKLQ